MSDVNPVLTIGSNTFVSNILFTTVSVINPYGKLTFVVVAVAAAVAAA